SAAASSPKAPYPPRSGTPAPRSRVRAGARLLGGCCRVGPNRITEIAALLNAERNDPYPPRA
ncbi:homocysteine S-methyltransferase family protein, partial [Streptomyces sp. NPDC050428]|uniref:homocysteine S-methyltransferase family protein n=1 Tax=Streptomyces sp. NPDC050428 TaxID=3155757 RepID=UPI00341F9F58